MRYSSSLFEPLAVFGRSHRMLARLAAILVLILALVLCWNLGKIHEKEEVQYYVEIPQSRETLNTDFPYLALTPLDWQTEQGNAVQNLSERADGLTITEGGEYLISGRLDGTVHILAKDDNVHLFLDGATISAKSGPAIYCEEADKLVITLLPGTENYISDSGKYPGWEEVDACIYSTCDLTINGSGSLKVSGYFKDAVRSSDVLKLIESDVNIKCKRAGLHGSDGIVVYGGAVVVASEKNGMRTTKSGIDGRGCLVVTGGVHSIIAGRYAFVTDKASLYVYDCTVYNRSIVNTYNVGGIRCVQEGCVQ